MFSSPYQPARVGAGDRRWSVAVASRRGVAWSIFGRPSVRNKERLEQRLLQPFRWVCSRTALPKSGAQSLDRSDVGLNERRYQLHHVRGHSTGRGFPCWAHVLKPPSLPVVLTGHARLPAPTQQWPSQPLGLQMPSSNPSGAWRSNHTQYGMLIKPCVFVLSRILCSGGP